MKRHMIQKNIGRDAKPNPRLAQIPTINPKYICGSRVFNTSVRD